MKLTRGQGSPETGGCWMVAASMYATGTWSDQPECVPPTLRKLCIALNDMCGDGEREELIGPHLFAPMGRDASPEAEMARANLCADWAVERYALGSNIDAWARGWLSGKDRTKFSAISVEAVARAAVVASPGCVKAAAAAAVAAAWAASAARGCSQAAEAAAAAAGAAMAAAAMAAGDKRALLDLILRCCEIGNNPPRDLDPRKVREVMRAVCREGE